MNADVDDCRDAMFKQIREGVQLRPVNKNGKSDDEGSKKTQTSPKPIVHKQQDAQSADKSKEQPAKEIAKHKPKL